MSGWESDLLDEFLTEAAAEGPVGSVLDALATPAAPSGSLRDRLLASARLEGRFDRFAGVVAELMDVDAAGAKALLDGIGVEASWEASPIPDVHLFHIEGGPKVANAVTGFVRLPAGAVFPEHEHLGDEAVLVVSGSFRDGVSGDIHRPGDVVRMPAGSRHDFQARPGPDLVYLVVVYDGVMIGGERLGPDHPAM